MLKQILLSIALSTSAFASSFNISAEYGTPEEAKALLSRAIVEVKADKLEAISKFNHNDPQFRDRDLFVFCFNGQDGKFTAHEAMVAADVRTFRDPTGRSIGEQMYQTAKEGITEVALMSPVPGSTKLVPKRAYVTRIGDQVCGVSAYRFNGTSEPTQ
jgi:hypothetical protein